MDTALTEKHCSVGVHHTTSNNMERCPIFSSPGFCVSRTENEYTSPDLSATKTSSSAWVNTRDVHRRTTHLQEDNHRLYTQPYREISTEGTVHPKRIIT